MSWSISKGESYIIGKNKRLKFTGAYVHPSYVSVHFILHNDILERVLTRHIDNRECMYIGNVLHFGSKEIFDKFVNDIINELI